MPKNQILYRAYHQEFFVPARQSRSNRWDLRIERIKVVGRVTVALIGASATVVAAILKALPWQ